MSIASTEPGYYTDEPGGIGKVRPCSNFDKSTNTISTH